jgi:uncharacterized protein (DUF433 family)
LDWKERIAADAAVSGGKPVIKGTRLSIDYLLSLFAEGWSEQQVLENFPQLSQEDLRAVFAFAQTCMAEESYATLGKLG